MLAYLKEHYTDWNETLSQDDMGFGAFGENFTVAGLTEANVRIDDTWRVGQKAVIQVSQPRQLCWKLARRWRIKSLALQVQQTGRTGWYDHVLQRGVVSAGITLVLKNRPHPEWTVQHANLRIAVALAGYKADNGEYPKSLGQLAPKYLKTIPEDLFSGKPLKYQVTKTGYLLHSVGPNGKDDGGRWSSDKTSGDDIFIRMPLPKPKSRPDGP